MGLYSTIYSSFKKLGPNYVGNFQTKDLESILDEYSLSANGELFLIDYENCFTASRNEQPKHFLDHMKWEPTGFHARLKPTDYTGRLTMYRNGRTGWIEIDLMFENGQASLVLEKRSTPATRG